MQPLIPSLTFEQLRQAKKNASKSLESLGIELSSSTIGNHVAMMLGYQDWNIASAITKMPSNCKLPNEVFLSRRTSQIVSDADFTPPKNHNIGNGDMLGGAKTAAHMKIAFIEAVHDCAISMRLTHLKDYKTADTTMLNKILEGAILSTYEQYASSANFSHFYNTLKLIEVPSSALIIKEDILYLLSGKNPDLPINYYGAVLVASNFS